ncbi:MAG: hypothetical protein J6X50_03800, partial [Bacilli bacterium]|nr:hypothetical protein [Bacilli bacterium]
FTISVNHDVVETIDHDEHAFYSSYADVEKEDNKVAKVNKARVNKNRALRSNEAVVETSLLVIGAVDVLSMILIKRKRHLLR